MKHDQFELHADIEERHWWFVGRRRIMRELVRRVVPTSKLSTIVDVGCGTGANIAALDRDYSCIGIDTSREAVQLARTRFPFVEFVAAPTPTELAAIRGSADLFLLMDVLEHVEDDSGFLSEFLSGAKPGAHILITVPADPSLWSKHDVSFGHFRRYHRQRLAQLWAGLPVTTRLLSYYNSRLHPIVKGVRTLNQWTGRTSGMAGTDFQMPLPPLNRILEGILAGESRVLVDTLEGRRQIGYSSGVSLIALLRRDPGRIEPGAKGQLLSSNSHDQEPPNAK